MNEKVIHIPIHTEWVITFWVTVDGKFEWKVERGQGRQDKGEDFKCDTLKQSSIFVSTWSHL